MSYHEFPKWRCARNVKGEWVWGIKLYNKPYIYINLRVLFQEEPWQYTPFADIIIWFLEDFFIKQSQHNDTKVQLNMRSLKFPTDHISFQDQFSLRIFYAKKYFGTLNLTTMTAKYYDVICYYFDCNEKHIPTIMRNYIPSCIGGSCLKYSRLSLLLWQH